MSEQRGATLELIYLWLAVSIAGIITGGVLWAAGYHDGANVAWAVTTAVGLLPLVWETLVGLCVERSLALRRPSALVERIGRRIQPSTMARMSFWLTMRRSSPSILNSVPAYLA